MCPFLLSYSTYATNHTRMTKSHFLSHTQTMTFSLKLGPPYYRSMAIFLLVMLLVYPSNSGRHFYQSLHHQAVVEEVSPSSTLNLFVGAPFNNAVEGMAVAELGTLTQPFRTLTRARDEVRSLLQSEEVKDTKVNVNVRGGMYQMDEPFRLSAQDSGTSAHNVVTYRSIKAYSAIQLLASVLSFALPLFFYLSSYDRIVASIVTPDP
jgi:hypothetical protein